MIQQNLLELAKQGDAQAIAALMNRQLQTRQILAKAELKEGCLQLLLESSTVPPQEQLVSYIYNSLKKLESVAIEKVVIYGKQTDSDFPSWQKEFNLNTSPDLNSLSIENNLKNNSSKGLVINSVKKNSSLLRCEGNNSILTVKGNGVLIERLGGFLSGHTKGEKIISYNRIEAIQFYTPTNLKYGFIYFKLVDSTTNNLGYLEAASNPNAIIFMEAKFLDFNKARHLILEYVGLPTQDINDQKAASTISSKVEIPDQKADSPINNTIQINVNSGPQGPQIACPKCGSNQVTANKKGFNAGQALVGGIATGGLGLLAGFWGSNDIRFNCLSCGNRWKP